MNVNKNYYDAETHNNSFFSGINNNNINEGMQEDVYYNEHNNNHNENYYDMSNIYNNIRFEDYKS